MASDSKGSRPGAVTPKQLGYYLVLMILVVANAAVFLPRVIASIRSPSASTTDLPRIGEELESVSLHSVDNEVLRVPSTEKPVTLLYFSPPDAESSGDLIFLESLLHSDVSAGLALIWIQLGGSTFSSTNRGEPLVSMHVVRPSNEDLRSLGLERPAHQSILFINSSGRILYEGPIFQEQVIQLVKKSVGLEAITSVSSLRRGDMVTGKLISGDGETTITLQDHKGLAAVLLYPGYCPSCSLNTIERVLEQVPALEVFPVVPGWSNLRDLQQLFFRTNVDREFWSLEVEQSSIDIDCFLVGVPTILLTRDGRMLSLFKPPNRISDLIDKVSRIAAEH